MSPSIFISRESPESQLVISLEVIERYFMTLASIPDCSNESAIYIAFRDTYGKLPFNPGDITVLEEWVILLDEIMKPKETPEPSGNSSKLLASLAKFLTELDIDTTLLMLCSGDFQRAKHLYSFVDARCTRDLIKSWVQLQMEQARACYESALYAFGGSLGSEAESNKKAVEPKNLQEAKRLGLSVVSDEDKSFFTTV